MEGACRWQKHRYMHLQAGGQGPPVPVCVHLCGAGDTSLPPRDARHLGSVVCRGCLLSKGVTEARDATLSPQVGAGVSGGSLGPYGSWLGMHFNCLEQWSMPGDKRADEKLERTGELWSGWRNA